MYFVGLNQEVYVQRSLRISGTQEAISAAKAHIEKIINQELGDDLMKSFNSQTKSYNSSNYNSSNIKTDDYVEEVLVPKDLAPNVFGYENNRLVSIQVNLFSFYKKEILENKCC